VIVLIGTVPFKTGVYVGQAIIDGDCVKVDAVRFPIERGTAAMAAACAQVCGFYGLPMPLCLFGGDISDGKGTDLMFREAEDNLEKYDPDVITMHYLFPKIAYGTPFIDKISTLPKKPQLIADAGGMYLMKTIGKADYFDVFTPDQGELLFLADEFAAHPLYVRTELLNQLNETASLVAAAYRCKNAAKTLVVKGAIDSVYKDGILIKECRQPNIPAMEAIGGTGDTITGMISGLRYLGDAAPEYKALIINRLIGQRVNCTPATQIGEFIKAIPATMEEYEKNPV
jgi:NAD(P)H-hydrate repair Nnr-like enzyme with NAD(P)H-hydrate dehydratase domain